MEGQDEDGAVASNRKVFSDLRCFGDNLRRFFKEQTAAEVGDVVLQVGDDQLDQCRPVHAFRVLLAAQSDVFRAMFFGGMKEAESSMVHIPNIDFATMSSLVEFCHTGQVELNIKVCFPLLAAADQYQVAALKDACAAFVQRDLSLDNCCDMLHYSHAYKLDALEERCLCFVEQHAEAVLEQRNFLQLPVDALIVVLKRSLRAAEIELFKAVARWAGEQKPSKEDLDRVMHKLRFPLINAKDLVSIVKPTGLVPIELYLEAIEFHATSSSANLDALQFQPRGSLFLWSAERRTILSEDGLTVQKANEALNGWNLLVTSNKEFSEGKLYWELTIDHINTDQSGMVVGVAPTGHPVSAYETSVGLGMAGSVYNTRLSGAREKIKQGDRIGVGVDFERKTVNFFHNGEFFATGELKWPKIRAVLFLFYPKNQVTLYFPVKSSV